MMAMTYIGPSEDLDELQEMFATLIATSMDTRTSGLAHPGYVEVIKQLTPDEARIVRHFADHAAIPLVDIHVKETATRGYKVLARNISAVGGHVEISNGGMLQAYFDNLARLGLISIEKAEILEADVYDEIIESPAIKSKLEGVNAKENRTAQVIRKHARRTSYGLQFIAACINDHDEFLKAQGEDDDETG